MWKVLILKSDHLLPTGKLWLQILINTFETLASHLSHSLGMLFQNFSETLAQTFRSMQNIEESRWVWALKRSMNFHVSLDGQSNQSLPTLTSILIIFGSGEPKKRFWWKSLFKLNDWSCASCFRQDLKNSQNELITHTLFLGISENCLTTCNPWNDN